MKNHYILPAGCALAFHAILLLGFNGKPPTPAVMVKATPPLERPPTVDVVDYVPRPVEPDPSEPAPQPQRGKTDAGNPGLPDLPTDSTFPDFVMAIPRVQPRIFAADKINPGIPGVPDGVLDGVGAVDATVDFTQLDNRPEVRAQVAPFYPAEARMRGNEGQVLVGFTVDVDGSVTAPYVIECTDNVFAQPAVAAVAKWRFMPGRLHGRAVRFRMAVPIVFRLNN